MKCSTVTKLTEEITKEITRLRLKRDADIQIEFTRYNKWSLNLYIKNKGFMNFEADYIHTVLKTALQALRKIK
jgi:hypothetical protein